MAADASPIRILIADGEPIFRAGLRQMFQDEPDLGVVGETGDGEEIAPLARSLRPNLLLLDPEMPRVGGLESLDRLAEANGRVNTLLLTSRLDRDRLVEAVRLGVRGVVSKTVCRSELLKAVRLVSAGQYWLGRDEVADVVESLLDERPVTPHRNGRAKPLPLTDREREVVAAVVRGLSNREIATDLAICEDTVKHHLTNIYDKVGVSSRVELVVYAFGHDLDGDS